MTCAVTLNDCENFVATMTKNDFLLAQIRQGMNASRIQNHWLAAILYSAPKIKMLTFFISGMSRR